MGTGNFGARRQSAYKAFAGVPSVESEALKPASLF
jgi:hypothetical protein